MIDVFGHNPDSTGTTFLYPTSAGVRNQIYKLAHGSAVEKDRAASAIQALIIPGFIDNIREFARYSKDLPNHNGMKLNIKSTTPTSATLANGAIITVIPSSRIAAPYAIYHLTGSIQMGGVPSEIKVIRKVDVQAMQSAYNPLTIFNTDCESVIGGHRIAMFAERAASFFIWASADAKLLVQYAPWLFPVPELTYLSLMMSFIHDSKTHADTYTRWNLDLNGAYIARNAKNIHADYANLYERLIARLRKNGVLPTSSARERVSSSRGLVEHIKRTYASRSGAFGIARDSLPILLYERLTSLLTTDSPDKFRKKIVEIVQLAKDYSPRNADDYTRTILRDTYGYQSFESTVRAFYFSNVFIYTPLALGECKGSKIFDFDRSEVFNPIGRLIELQSSRPPVAPSCDAAGSIRLIELSKSLDEDVSQAEADDDPSEEISREPISEIS